MSNFNPRPMAIPLTKAVKILLIANIGIWFFGQLLLEGYLGVSLQKYFALIPGRVMFELDGVEEVKARDALRRAGAKLPVKVTVVKR